MKIIKISTDNELTVHDFPEKDTARTLAELIGNGCEYLEMVRPMRLYTELHMESRVSDEPGAAVAMLVDESGLLKEDSKINIVGSWLYGSDRHGSPIVGNILFVGQRWINMGVDYCGIQDEAFNDLEAKLKNIVGKAKSV
jgi:hypothetical protein